VLHNVEAMTLSDLKHFLDKTVILRMTNGETATARVRGIDEEYDNLIVVVLETSTPERHPGRVAAYIIAASHIESAELAP
jgi:small nuclear ribonucleoprotein (snRNP)-like protein